MPGGVAVRHLHLDRYENCAEHQRCSLDATPLEPMGNHRLGCVVHHADLVLGGCGYAPVRPGQGFAQHDGIPPGDFSRPNFQDWRIYIEEMVITVHIALWGTVLAVICAIPCGLMSAENLVPSWVYQPMRRVMDAFRAINEMVFAMLFIVAVGLGPFAGVLALWVHTTGVLAELFAEAVEAIDPRPMEGVRATGPMPWRRFCTA